MRQPLSLLFPIVLIAVLLLALSARTSRAYPPAGTYPNGAVWAEITGADINTCDDVIGTGSLGYPVAHIYQYSTYYHSWQYAPPGSYVTFSCSLTGGQGYDRVWSGALGSMSAASYRTQVGGNGMASTPFAGIADVADRQIVYSAAADAGVNQINRGQASASATSTLHHTYTNPAVESHCVAESPAEGYWVSAGGVGAALKWDGYLKGFTPDLHHRFRLLCELFDENGGRLWTSDKLAYPPDLPNSDPGLVEFTAEGQHYQHVGTTADNPVPDLAFYIGSNVLMVVSVQEAIWYPGQWTSWTTVDYAGTQTGIQAERTFYVTP